MNPYIAEEVDCVLSERQARRSEGTEANTFNAFDGTWFRDSSFSGGPLEQPKIAGCYKPLAHCLCSGGLAARSLCHFELRNRR
jgi:hypothetical protein